MGLFDEISNIVKTLEQTTKNIQEKDLLLGASEMRDRFLTHCPQDKTLIIANMKVEKKGYVNLAQTLLKDTQTTKTLFYVLKTYQERKAWIRDVIDAYAYRASSKNSFFIQKELRNLGGIATGIKILVRENEISRLEKIFALRNTQEIRTQYAKMIGEMLKSYIRQEIDELRAKVNRRIFKYKEENFSVIMNQIVIFKLMQGKENT
ncbi:Uncharacterised protein [Helicobacter pametensis]|nr:Uncharacterised protein [Helicobacter pametensis]